MPSVILAGTTSGTALNLTGDTSGDLQFQTNNGSTTAMTLTTAGNVGIGTASPGYAMDVRSTSAPAIRLSRSGTAGQIASIVFEDGNAALGSGSTTRIASDSGAMSFSTGGTSGAVTGGTERGRFTSGGYFKASNNGTYNNVSGSNHEFYNSANAETLIVRNANASFNSEALIVSADRNTTNNSYYFLRLNVPGVANRLLIADSGSISTAGSVQLGDAGAPPTSGVGVKFPATQSASSDANTLDDYEEGTWTPSYTLSSGSVSGVTTSGAYVKIGKTVTVDFRLSFTTSSSGAINTITGLPFTVANTSQYPMGVSRENANTGYLWQVRANTADTTLLFRTYLNQDQLASGMTFFGSITYFVN